MVEYFRGGKEISGEAAFCAHKYTTGEVLHLRSWLAIEPLRSDDDFTLQDKMHRITRLLEVLLLRLAVYDSIW